MPERRAVPIVAIFTAFLVALLRAGWPGEASAGYIETVGLSPRSAAMGGAAVAVAETPDAWYYNPAGMAQITADMQEVGFPQIAFLDIESTDNTGSGGRVTDITPTIYTFHLPSTFHLGPEGLVFGIGGGATFGQTAEWSQTKGDLRYSAYESSLFLNTLSPCVAYEVLPGLFVGATFNIDALRQIESRQKLGDGFFTDAAIDDLGLDPALLAVLEPLLRSVLNSTNGVDDGKFEVETDREFPTGLAPSNTLDIDFESWSWHAGVLWRPIEHLRFGLVYRDRMKVDFEGTARVVFADDVKSLVNDNPILVALNGGPLEDERARFKAPVEFPRQLAAGVAFQATDRILIALDGVWTDWSDAWDRQKLLFGGEGLLGLKEQVFVRDFRDTYEVRLGWEVKATERLWTQAGVWWDPTPVPDRTVDSGTLDSDRILFSVGTTLKDVFAGPIEWEALEGLDLGVVFQWLQFFERKIGEGQSINLGGTRRYESTVNDFPVALKGAVYNVGASFIYYY